MNQIAGQLGNVPVCYLRQILLACLADSVHNSCSCLPRAVLMESRRLAIVLVFLSANAFFIECRILRSASRDVNFAGISPAWRDEAG